MRRLTLLVTAFAIAGCPAREVSKIDPSQQKEERKEVPVDFNRDLDLLFVIDNSGSMGEEQVSLAQNFPQFIQVLSTIEGGLPNVHIGVVSTDVGIGGYTGVQYCDKNGGKGDDGLLQNTPRVSGCTPPSGFYIKDVALSDGSRDRNYAGTLEDTFSCIAQLGITGCGFEQPLESMKRALDGHLVQNADFLRPNAYLAVVIITDEDDCSARDSTVFDPSQTAVSDPLGPLDSYRCTEFGIRGSGGAQILGRQPATYTDCVPCGDPDTADHCYMQHPDAYVDFLKTLKPADPDHMIIVAGIYGNPTPVNVTINSKGGPDLQPSCGVDRNQPAEPAVRLDYFVNQFPNRNTYESICQPDLSGALLLIANLLKKVLGDPCFESDIVTDDVSPAAGLQIDCQVADVTGFETENEVQTPIPRCIMPNDDPTADPDPSSPNPCWYAKLDTTKCAAYPSQLSLVVWPSDRNAPPGTTVVARCQQK